MGHGKAVGIFAVAQTPKVHPMWWDDAQKEHFKALEERKNHLKRMRGLELLKI